MAGHKDTTPEYVGEYKVRNKVPKINYYFHEFIYFLSLSFAFEILFGV